MNTIPTAKETTAALASLAQFIGPIQRRILACNASGPGLLERVSGERDSKCEERDFFRTMICELAANVAAMPKTYETNGQGYKATAHLHYFAGGQASWYITEKDCDTDGEGQLQAFGLADLFGDGGEIGYISIAEILEAGGELDLYWTPKTLGAITGKPEVSEDDQEAVDSFNATA